MLSNDKIADQLEQLADLLEFTGANPFRLKAYRNGARIVREYPQSLESLIQTNYDLTGIEGIGKGVAEKCLELINTGKLAQLEQILETVPATVLDLLKVPKLGPKKAAALYQQLQITSLPELKAACEQGRVRQLSGFGEKTEQAILAGIEVADTANRRILWSVCDELVARLRRHLEACDAIEQLEFAGSYRRGKDSVGDLDILVVSPQPAEVMQYFARFQEIGQELVRGETKMSVRLENNFQVDLRVVPAESFGAALQYFTGSKEHNVIVRGRARQRGLKVNEWGVFRVSDDPAQPDTRIAGSSEQEVYQALELPWFPPELREARGEFVWAEAIAEGRQPGLPRLIEATDIVADLHMHTVATDGSATIEEMAAAARQRGLKFIAITDHSKRVAMANGLNAERLLAQWAVIDQINQRCEDGFRILKGIECDILENGEMDLPDEILAQGDWIIASLHYGQTQSREQITDRLLRAIRNPHVCLVAHPTGRLIHRREPYQVDLTSVFQAAVEHRKFLELNANPQRLDLNDIHLANAKSLGIPIVINTDAHHPRGFEDLRYGIMQARRGGLTPQDVANTRSWPEMRQMLGR
jgi:DNA polymerase (family 10)